MPINPTYNEKELFTRIAEGDEQAFALLYEQVLPVLHGFILKMLKSEDATQEVIQEAFIRIWLNRDKLPGVEYPKAWISKVALNECYKSLRKQAQQRKGVRMLTDSLSIAFNQAEDRLSLAETQRLISISIEELPERRKLIYFYRYFKRV